MRGWTSLFLGLVCVLGLATGSYAQQTARVTPFNMEMPKADVPMPPEVVLIVCKTKRGDPVNDDPNAKWTGVENREWLIEDSKLQCMRHEIQVFDQAEAQGADYQPFNHHRCMAAGIMIGVSWDMSHKSSKYRFWKVACPTPIKNYGPDGIKGTPDDRIVGWKMPECGHRDTVVCEDWTEV